MKLARRACQVTGRKNASSLDTLAAAYAEAGRFKEAVVAAQEAIELAGAAKQQAAVRKMQQRLALYRKQQPYHERE